MEILKHGDLRRRVFTCKYCGCIFIADLSEYSIAASGNNFFTKCPECKSQFDMYAPLYTDVKNQQHVIRDTTEPIEYNNWTHSMYCEWLDAQGGIK